MLALAAGSFDALCYLGLHNVFPANMTGNTVLLAVALARGSGLDAVRSAAALGGFAVGVACSTFLMPRHFRRWPEGAAWVLLLEVAILVAILVWWLTVGVPAVRYWLIVLAGGAMGAQSTAVYFSHANGVSTTYMTGTLMKAIVRAVHRLRRAPRLSHPRNLPGAAWVAYIAGALLGAVVERSWSGWSVLIPVCLVSPVALGAALIPIWEARHDSDRHERPGPAGRR